MPDPRQDTLAVVAVFGDIGLADPGISVCGAPLSMHAIEHAIACSRVARVAVATDREAIANAATRRGAIGIVTDRPGADPRSVATARTLARAHGDGLDHVVCLHSAVALRTAKEIGHALVQLDQGAQGVFPTAMLLGSAHSFTESWHRRSLPATELVSFATGSFWACKRAALLEPDEFDAVEWQPMPTPWRSQVIVRDAEDVKLAESVLGKRRMEPSPKLKDISLVVFDFDGVFTDNRVLTMQDGTEGVLCSRGDGMGLELLRKCGVPILVLSKEKNPVVAARCRKLKLECVQGIDDKAGEIGRLARERVIDLARVAYVGNDTNDLGPMAMVGLPIAVADAHPECLNAAKLVLGKAGGFGAVREICDFLLAAKESSA